VPTTPTAQLLIMQYDIAGGRPRENACTYLHMKLLNIIICWVIVLEV